MTAHDGFTPRLETWLAEEGAELTPDYLGDVLARTTTTRQRPAWASLERWLPMTTTLDPTRRISIPPAARYLLLGAAIVLVALAALLVYAGAHQTRTPAPFGPAANGRIVYASQGDIFAIDPDSGAVHSIATGPDADSEPEYSPDGNRIAFRRSVPGAGEVIVVTREDGSSPVILGDGPTAGGLKQLDWSPDSRFVLATTSATPTRVLLFDAAGSASPRLIASDVDPYQRPFRPPTGAEVLVRRATPDGDAAIVAVDVATGTARTVVTAIGGATGEARWSPDGSRIVYDANPVDKSDSHELFLVNADGSDAHRVTTMPGTWYVVAETWSPDGSRIAFTRWDADRNFEVHPLSILTLADGSVRDLGPLAREVRSQAPTPEGASVEANESYAFDWSPDGSSLIAVPSGGGSHVVVIAVPAGTYRLLEPVLHVDWVSQVWQRRAP